MDDWLWRAVERSFTVLFQTGTLVVFYRMARSAAAENCRSMRWLWYARGVGISVVFAFLVGATLGMKFEGQGDSYEVVQVYTPSAAERHEVRAVAFMCSVVPILLGLRKGIRNPELNDQEVLAEIARRDRARATAGERGKPASCTHASESEGEESEMQEGETM